jgi:uridine kinase
VVIELDDFYRPIPDDKNYKISVTKIYECYFDSKRFRDLVLYPLIHGLPSRYRRYDWFTNQQAEWIDLTPARFVIVDGVFSTLPELRSLYNVTVFVNTDKDVRLSRIQKRFYKDMSWLDDWIDAENLYMENLQPIQYVDLVLDGSNIE